MDVRVLITLSLFCLSSMGNALQDLTEEEMVEVSGEGVALVYEDYQFNAKSNELDGSSDLTFKITGITESNGNPVDISLSHVYIAGPGSNYGADLEGRVVNLGRLTNPYTIDMLDGNDLDANPMGWSDKAVLSIAAPSKLADTDSDPLTETNPNGYDCTDANAAIGSGTCTSRPATGTFGQAGYYHGERADIGIRLNNDFDGAVTTRDMNINIHGQSMHFDGSYLRLWGGDADVDASDVTDGTTEQTMMMEAQINVYADKLVINSCNFDGTGCGNSIVYDQFKLELALGDAKYYQPATFDVNSSGNFVFKIQPLPGPGDSRVASSVPGSGDTWTQGQIDPYGRRTDSGTDPATYDWYLDYYTNGRKSNFSVDNMTVGGENFGASRITNMQIQYLEVTSHDL